jgi:hypothetical protein
MAEQTRTANGTVTEEAARLIDAIASMARSSADANADSGSYAGEPAHEPGSPGAPEESRRSEHRDAPSDGGCNVCGGESNGAPVACRLCPLCQGIALLRSVRPETVDRLADLATAVAGTLRDMAAQSRASGQTSAARPDSGKASGGGRAPVQDIHVDDDDEG